MYDKEGVRFSRMVQARRVARRLCAVRVQSHDGETVNLFHMLKPRALRLNNELAAFCGENHGRTCCRILLFLRVLLASAGQSDVVERPTHSSPGYSPPRGLICKLSSNVPLLVLPCPPVGSI